MTYDECCFYQPNISPLSPLCNLVSSLLLIYIHGCYLLPAAAAEAEEMIVIVPPKEYFFKILRAPRLKEILHLNISMILCARDGPSLHSYRCRSMAATFCLQRRWCPRWKWSYLSRWSGQNVLRLKKILYLNTPMILPAHAGMSLYTAINNGKKSVATMMTSKREAEPCNPYPESKHQQKRSWTPTPLKGSFSSSTPYR